MSLPALHRSLLASLAAAANPAAVPGMARYFPAPFHAYGIRNADVAALADAFLAANPDLDAEARLALCEVLLARAERHEEVMLAFALVRRLVKRYDGPNLLPRCRAWLASAVTNWAQCDDLCLKVVFAYQQGHPDRVADVADWAHAASPWSRRAACVALVKWMERRIGRHTYRLPPEVVFGTARLLRDDPHPYVQKGVGWLLKAASVHHADAVVAYLLAQQAHMPRATVRYALEKMDAAHRARVAAGGRGVHQ